MASNKESTPMLKTLKIPPEVHLQLKVSAAAAGELLSSYAGKLIRESLRRREGRKRP